MDGFAKLQLMKYGWREGKGLGKHEDGITEALKPKLKFDTAGVGHRDKDWNWWEAVFNKAADSIKVDSNPCNVSISVTKDESTNDLHKDRLNKRMYKPSVNYDNFIQTSTLLNGNLIEQDKSDKYKVEDTTVNIPSFTDEELFKICGGRTGHKGARHGLTLNGKLNRIAQQERELLNALKNRPGKLEDNNNSFEINEYRTSNNNDGTHSSKGEISLSKTSKSGKGKCRNHTNNLVQQLNISCNVSDKDKKELKVDEKDKCKQCKRKREKISASCNIEGIGIEKIDNDDTVFLVCKKKGKREKRKIQEQTNNYSGKNVDNECRHSKKKKKSKKKMDRDHRYEFVNDALGDEEMGTPKIKKSKKSKESDSTLELLEDENTDVMNQDLQTNPTSNDTFRKTSQANDATSDTDEYTSHLINVYLRKKVDTLNFKIKKKKKAKLQKKQRIKLDMITESLKAVHFNIEERVEEKSAKKKLKAAIKNLKVTDKTEFLKKKEKKAV